MTDNQLETYLYVVRYAEAALYQPSQNEIALATGVSRRTVYERLRQLSFRSMALLPADETVDRNLGLPLLRGTAYSVAGRGRRARQVEVSDKQMEAYLYVVRHVERWLFQPTQEEMASALGVTRRAVHDRLLYLAEKKLIVLPEGNLERNVGFPHLRLKVWSCRKGAK